MWVKPTCCIRGDRLLRRSKHIGSATIVYLLLANSKCL